MGEGWHQDFDETHFDIYSPPDFYVKVCRTTFPLIAGVKVISQFLNAEHCQAFHN